MNDDELLITRVTTAHRERDAHGQVQSHPAWHDLDEAGRRAAFEQTLRLRRLEAALDEQGLSSTVRAVLARLR